MDNNKLSKLIEVGYTVNECCGLCKHFDAEPHKLFGLCAEHTYKHAKHSEEESFLSVTRYGKCFNFELNVVIIPILHKYADFIED